MKTLGLDVSSSVIGWALLDDSERLLEYGNIVPPKSSKGSLSFRLSATYDLLFELLKNKKPNVVSIESYVSKFSPGRSSARTIIVLSCFNELASMVCIRSLGIEAEKHTVSRIRSFIKKNNNLKIISKDETFEFIKSKYPNFNIRKNRNGNISKSVFDESDAIAVGLARINSRGS